MTSGFAGETAQLYARYRRDLPASQAVALARAVGLRPGDVVVDLGCGTGQLAVPLAGHCAAVLALDPEPDMLSGLRARAVDRITCVLGDDADLPRLGRLLAGPVGAVVIGNALHWMDEPTALQRCAALVRPGGAVAVITQGPPLWQGTAPWQVRVRAVLEAASGPADSTCGSDEAALTRRAEAMSELGLEVSTHTWRVSHPVDGDWVVGHLGSALPSGAIDEGDPSGLAAAVRAAMDEHDDAAEVVTTTAVIGRRPA